MGVNRVLAFPLKPLGVEEEGGVHGVWSGWVVLLLTGFPSQSSSFLLLRRQERPHFHRGRGYFHLGTGPPVFMRDATEIAELRRIWR